VRETDSSRRNSVHLKTMTWPAFAAAYMYMCVCVCVYTYIYICIHTHTHTHTHTYIHTYIQCIHQYLRYIYLPLSLPLSRPLSLSRARHTRRNGSGKSGVIDEIHLHHQGALRECVQHGQGNLGGGGGRHHQINHVGRN